MSRGVSNAEHGRFVRETAELLAKWYREGNTAEIEAMRAEHRALGYGRVVHEEHAATRCVCGMWLRDEEWAAHVAGADDPNSLHRWMCRENSLELDTPARPA